jgi:hypothetical protein
MVQYVPRGPIAQWLEQPAHKCAHAPLHSMPAEAGGTEVDVSKAGSYLDGKPERDRSMTCKSLVETRDQAAMLYMVKAALLEPQSIQSWS